jgi:hypothetical protein
MSEHRTDEISRELRATAPPAPDGLRERVRVITAREQTATRRLFPGRRMLALAAAAALVLLTLGAALVPRLADREKPRTAARAPEQARTLGEAGTPDLTEALSRERAAAGTLPPGRRLQDYRAAITLRVDDADALSEKAQQAMRETRRMGGFVASVDFATQREDGTASLVLRVPVTRIQEAVARFSELGTIISQNVEIDDLQPTANRLSSSITRLRARIAALAAKERRTPAEEAELLTLRGQLQTHTRRLQRLTNEARYATMSLALTTKQAERDEEPGAFRTFWDDASKILLTELIWLLYALVVAGPFVLLAILALVAERARRRRSADALLAHH